MDKAVSQYLNRYAESETALLADVPVADFEQVLVIPAFAEKADFLNRIETTLLPERRWLIIIVVNQPEGPEDDHADNRQLVKAITSRFNLLAQQKHLSLLHHSHYDSQCLLVERFKPGLRLPQQEGVGRARKIGCDIAAALWAQQNKAGLIHTSDADVHWPPEYGKLQAEKNTAALLYPFFHRCDESALGRATALYERSLQHYVDALQSAGSPYAFHTIGSTLAINSLHYCRVRGFPKRAGGEDFYLLNKLAKLGRVQSLDKPTIGIDARRSQRAPFGTGPAVAKLLYEIDGSEYVDESAEIFYSPQIFVELGKWLRALPKCFVDDSALNNLPADVHSLLMDMGLAKALAHSRKHGVTPEAFYRHMHDWFDGFRTLKFVHALRDSGLKSVSEEQLRQCQL